MPTDEQTENYKAQYLSTIRSYIKEFGVLPPAAIWDVTKFDKDTIKAELNILKEKRNNPNSSSFQYNSADSTPLYESFNSQANEGSFLEFNGFDSGNGSGAGASGHWGSYDDGVDGGDSGGDSGGDGGGCSGGCGD